MGADWTRSDNREWSAQGRQTGRDPTRPDLRQALPKPCVAGSNPAGGTRRSCSQAYRARSVPRLPIQAPIFRSAKWALVAWALVAGRAMAAQAVDLGVLGRSPDIGKERMVCPPTRAAG